ncbi:CDP-alcohol phosphatidyltransferase family protein [Flexilinea flocculi]|jgi:CDP-diacylglycerol--glycerol-3-phosphate 3-phosphatidyltransferase|uniref:Phosphatidylglycerophosphate synthase n=1 Tax=Flexilinea flocculi TaxID=1678840 RepID=A0A0S7BTS0_9CHLR|nr:CDP-alcohol phosphatidyltransferase family protein [Flexilinea flocculi]GAP40612.1 phosphatidylglycerophosphate synthase [Flexilinea flocculi]
MTEKITFSDRCRVWFKQFGDISSRFLLKIGLSANAVTIIGCVGHLFAAYLAAVGQFTWAGILLLFFAVTDFFDGTMSRMTTGGKGTKFGAVLDSTTDRYAEFMIFGGLIYYYAVHGDYLLMIVSYAAIMGSILVSYTRAKGEIAGLNMKLGLMSRLERYLFLVPCLFFNVPFIAMWAIALGSQFTAIQRIVHIYREFKRIDAETSSQKKNS